ncbi:MAG: YebC/PmpR family DNA-binding transcriptional regulator [Rickettsiales bacterium]|jgi:YebC/PmpR family DNA-binding regulatory protein|nr:YebC/PmpR family DNA-binding transcriptional regulator [Rickettsiales bacterium]
MSGHSKWATTKHKKAIIDAKRGKNFTKLLKEITIATKLGDPNPDFNPRLRSAVIAAKAASMPKDNITNAIKKATGMGAGENWEEIRYEGRGFGGIALIVEALTDNKNRSASSIRSTFSKYGGAMGETGSVSFMFKKIGIIGFEGKVADENTMLEEVINAGGDNVESDEEYHEITTSIENFIKVRDVLMAKFGEPSEAALKWVANESVVIDDLEKAEKINKFIEILEDNEDVQNVYYNFEFSDEIAEKLG